MSEKKEQPKESFTEAPPEETNMQIAFAAVLMARRETFLARYPRNLKLVVAALLLWVLYLPFTFLASHQAPQDAAVDLVAAHEQAVQSEAQLATKKPKAKIVEGRVELKTEAEKKAAAFNDSNEAVHQMGVAPDMALVEETPTGRLPTVSADGRRPWQVYARPFDYQDPRPRIALVVGDLGFSRVAADAALRRLPPAVTLAFDVEGTSIDQWLIRARQDGHETLLALPMEPSDYPRSDPGPNALLTTLPNADNIHRLFNFLKIGSGYIGVTTMSGSRFATDPNKLAPVMEEIKKRGLLVFDARVNPYSLIDTMAKDMKIPVASNMRVVDVNPLPAAIDAALADLEQTARVEGTVVGVASPLPVTLERIELWAKELASRGVVLAPLSAVVQ